MAGRPIDAVTRSRMMAAVKSRDTMPERIMTAMLAENGVEFETHSEMAGTPDVVVRSRKVAIFVNGCFWHWHGCRQSSVPRSNRSFWLRKLVNNRLRDRRNARFLRSRGWRVITVWECGLSLPRRMATFRRVLSLLGVQHGAASG